MPAMDDRPAADPEALFARWREGRDPAALGALFDAAAPGLFRLALSLTRDAAAAEDALQETFLFAMEEAERHDPSRPVVPWLAGILRLKVLEERRRNARAPRADRVAPPAAVEDPELAAMDAEERERLHEAMRRLPEPYRGVALLRWRYGLEPAEIADARGVAPGTVWSWLHRAVARLKVSMGALPALLVSFRPERGLDGVRRALLRQAVAKSAATAASGAAAVTTMGGFLMANKAIAVGAAAVLLGAAGWAALRTSDGPAAPAPGPIVARAPDPSPPPAPPPPVPAGDAAAADAPPALPPPVDLSKCDRDLDLFGEVVDGEGRPVAGAVLRIEDYPWRAVHSMNSAARHELRPGPETLSASDGTFRLRLSRGDSVALRVSKEGLAERFLDQCLAGERLRVVLARGADVAVTVRDPTGAPAAGTELRLWRMTPSYALEIERRGVTDAAGRFVFDAITPGKSYLSAEHPAAALPNWAHPDIPESGVLEVEVTLPAAQAVRGRVVDARTGDPLPGARVGIGWTMLLPVTAGADGTYVVEGWAPKQGRPQLLARAEGYVGVLANIPDSGSLDFELAPGDTVSGRIVDPTGAPIEGALLTAQGSRNQRGPLPDPTPWDTLHARTAADGKFLVRGLDHASAHTLVATAKGRGLLLMEFPPAASEGGTVDLGDVVLGPGHALEGMVLDLEGNPAPAVGVVLTGRFPDRGRRLQGGIPSDPEPRRSAQTRKTDDLGRFRFADLSPGPWLVSARFAGRPPLEKEVVIPADRDVLDVRLGGPNPDLASLVIRVSDEADAPVAGVELHLHPPKGQAPLPAISDERGTVRWDALERKPHSLMLLLPAPLRERFVFANPGRVTPGGSEFRVVLREAAEVRGVVVNDRGAPEPDVLVVAFGADERAPQVGAAFADERGEFVLRVPRGDVLHLALTGQKKTPAGSDPRASSMPSALRGEIRGVTAPATEVRIVSAEPVTNGRLEVLVLDADGKPFPDVTVSLQGGAPYRGVRTDAEGKALFEDLGPAKTMVLVQPDRRNSLPEDAVPPAGQWVEPAGQSITVRFTRGVALRGRVLLPDGSPAVGANVSAFEPEKAIHSASTKADADGRFRLAFPAGERPHISSSITAADGRFLIGFLESVESGAQDLEIRLRPKGE